MYQIYLLELEAIGLKNLNLLYLPDRIEIDSPKVNALLLRN